MRSESDSAEQAQRAAVRLVKGHELVQVRDGGIFVVQQDAVPLPFCGVVGHSRAEKLILLLPPMTSRLQGGRVGGDDSRRERRKPPKMDHGKRPNKRPIKAQRAHKLGPMMRPVKPILMGHVIQTEETVARLF